MDVYPIEKEGISSIYAFAVGAPEERYKAKWA